MTALGDAWISEMWRPCRELSYGERMAKRKADAIAQAQDVSTAVEKPVQTVEKRAS